MNQWKWCITDSQGKVIKGWYKDDDSNWYFLNDEGVMQTGWIQDKDGKWYYLYPQNTTNYGINYPTGAMVVDWVKLGDYWYYFLKESDSSKGEFKGQMVTGDRMINGKSYTFDKNGHMLDDTLVSDNCVNFVKEYEAFFNHAYYDGTGYTDAQLTIGYGTTKASVPEAFNDGVDSTITEEKACYYLKQEIEKMAKIIKADLDSKGVSLIQSQQDALYSFSYNCGESALLNSTLYRNICNGVRDKDTITANFQAWSMAGGKRLDGLYKRRTAESKIFNEGIYDSTH